MKLRPKITIADHFNELEDPRIERTKRHKLKDKPAIHMVSAWATNNGLVLGQKKVDDKSNEITAIPELLKVLSLKGCIVTIDAIGCQKKIIKQITNQDSDYVIALKKNQGGLYERVEKLFEQAILTDFQGLIKTEYRQSEDGRGRAETRSCQILTNINQEIDPKGEWKGLNSVAYVDYLRTQNGKTTLERRYFISSLNANNHQAIAIAIRKHWCIENQLHWVLDVSFNEDDSRIRKDNSPENLAIIRHIALNLLKQEKTLKVGIKNKRKNAGWDDKYLIKVLIS